MTYRIALTADLHFGVRPDVDERATLPLVQALLHNPPDLLVLAGDIGAAEEFDRCLSLFDPLPSRKALVPGNHDIWVLSNDARGDSRDVYEHHLPRIASRHGFHILDLGPLFLPEVQLAIVGMMNWYDYSWSVDRLRNLLPDWEVRLKTKRFLRGRHNDANYVRWSFDDISFTRYALDRFTQQLLEATERFPTIAIFHHPPFRSLNYPRDPGDDPDGLLWEAFSGNAGLEALLASKAEHIPFAFCGHTHYARDGMLGPIRGHNIGGDYHFKRLLRLHWPRGELTTQVFAPDEE